MRLAGARVYLPAAVGGLLALVALQLWQGLDYWSYSEGVYALTSRLWRDGADLYGSMAAAQPPGLFVILSERDVTFRQIFLDGRPLPDDPTPTPNGYSIGRWEGDTLVVQSVGFRDGTWLDRNGSPMTEAAKMT